MSLSSATEPLSMRRRPRYSARPFALTILAVSVLALLAWAKSSHANGASDEFALSNGLSRRDVLIQGQECRLVHQAADKCAFVRANCPDEEAGIFSYLSLYYCHLPRAKPVAFAILVLWLALLFSTIGIAASDFFCVNLSTIADLLGMSESMAGVTFLAFGNGSPDVFSTFAAFNTNSASLAIGELIGAAGFITAVVAGSMALVRPFNVARRSFVRDVGFFIVAATFSMVFIWDGKLTLWESCTMVGFYVFYVCFVMAWHWWLGRRKARKLKAAAMRSHFVVPGGEEEEIPQEYHDEDDGPASERRPNLMRGVSADDFAALERGDSGDLIEADENEAMRERWLGELNDNMRVSRPQVGRRNTHTPIRPSLVGALEFRAVLSSLQKSRNIQTIPIHLRRYSDDPTFTTAQQQDHISTTSDPAPRPPYYVDLGPSEETLLVTRPTADVQRHLPNRLRAVSTNDLDNARFDPETLRPGVIPTIDFGPASPEDGNRDQSTSDPPPPSPVISLSPPGSEYGSTVANPVVAASNPNPTPNRLAPPVWEGHGSSLRSTTTSSSPLSSPPVSASNANSAKTRPKPKLVVPEPSSPPVPFPAYTDYPTSAHSSRAPSLRLPSPSISAASLPSDYFADHIIESSDRAKVPRWWPSRVLPSPTVLLSTFFPTLSHWRNKNIWDKMLGIVAAPSVFLLTATLPVVEAQKSDADNTDPASVTSFSFPDPLTPINGSLTAHQRSMVSDLDLGSLSGENASRSLSKTSIGKTDSNGRPDSAVTISTRQPEAITITAQSDVMQSPEQLPMASPSSDLKSWNRWLVILQTFTAPFFIVLVVWANTELEYPRALLRPTMYSLLFSLCILGFLLTTTTPDRPPRWRPMLCFLGFAVSIAWISSIANEVVGVLKTLGVIMNMSDAILGLTIFAVGNSLGDFVADITVARLGFPVMALSACFGGPMLNILLGIGLSGCWIILKGGRHRHDKHPDRPMHFKPYPIEISTTLVISGSTLLVTLVGLLVVVPWRGWKMDKKIGWGLVALWCISTVVNVVVEVLGFSSSVS